MTCRQFRIAAIVAAAIVIAFAPSAAPVALASADASGPEARAAAYFDSIRTSPPQQLAFLRRMPKGGDLHNHLSGAIYAESFVGWAADAGLCVTAASVLSPPPCDEAAGRRPVATARTNSALFEQLVNAWSMRDWTHAGESGHDHFFNTFGKFGAATTGHTGDMLAEATERAAEDHVSYVEFMLTPDGGLSSQIGRTVGWSGDADATRQALDAAGIARAAAQAIDQLKRAEAAKDAALGCGTAAPRPGCAVTIRYVNQVTRTAGLGEVFAQMVTGFTLANDPDSHVVALNLVAPEDDPASMAHFDVEMAMLHALRPHYPHAHVTLHAGELAVGLVPPEGLATHIRASIEAAGAERIGHGVDVMGETDALGLLREMATRRVCVEICLTSNDVILGVHGPDHPLASYRQFGVPVALATDDEGVSRSDMTREYLRAAQDQHLGYGDLKTMARTSLEFAFIGGASLWTDATRLVRAAPCAADAFDRAPSPGCAAWLQANARAGLQWRLERDFATFEQGPWP